MDNLTEQILVIISKSLPYSYTEIERLYEQCKSFDKTIFLAEWCISRKFSIIDYDEIKKHIK